MKNFFFDYFYYRLTKAYFKWDGRSGNTAIMGISMIQFLIITNILTIGFHVMFARSTRPRLPGWTPYLGVVIMLSLIIVNYFKYRKKYNQLRSRWKDEDHKARFLKGVVVILSLTLPWILLIVLINYT